MLSPPFGRPRFVTMCSVVEYGQKTQKVCIRGMFLSRRCHYLLVRLTCERSEQQTSAATCRQGGECHAQREVDVTQTAL